MKIGHLLRYSVILSSPRVFGGGLDRPFPDSRLTSIADSWNTSSNELRNQIKECTRRKK